MYESSKQRPLSRAQFLRRLLGHLLVVVGIVGASLVIGMLGYVCFERLSWLDAFLNAAMLLGGMGPVDFPQTEAGKLFAGLYALFAAVALIAVTALLVSPVIHRVLHRFHWERGSGDGTE